MSFWNIKNERKLIDGFVVLVAASSVYFGGFIQTLNLGSISITTMFPVGFIIILTFTHLVLRKSRKFDESEHSMPYLIFKSIVFLGMIFFSYRSGLSSGTSLIPERVIPVAITLLLLLVSIYLMSYRANLNS